MLESQALLTQIRAAAKIQHMGFMPTQNRFSVSILSMKQNFLSVLRTMKYAVIFVINLFHGTDNLRNRIF